MGTKCYLCRTYRGKTSRGAPPPLILNRVNDVIKEETKKHNPNWPEIPDHPYRMLIIEDPGSKKTNPLFNLTN